MTGIRYIDTHCHLTDTRYAGDLDQVIHDSLAAGVGMLTMGADMASSRRCLELAERHRGVLAAVGIHPCDVAEASEEDWDELVMLARSPRVAAIGETGLDYYWKNVPAETQKRWLARHIELAIDLGKPLSVHARESVGDVLAMLEPAMRRGMKAIWHCFVAGKKEIDAALDFAVANRLYLALGGLATFEDQKPLRSRVARIPEDLLLLETDAPYLSPRPKKADRNVPAGVIRVAEALAELRGTSAERIAEITTRNAETLLGKFLGG